MTHEEKEKWKSLAQEMAEALEKMVVPFQDTADVIRAKITLQKYNKIMEGK